MMLLNDFLGAVMETPEPISINTLIPECFSVFVGTHYQVAMAVRNGIPAKSVGAIAQFLDVRTESLARNLGIPTDPSNPEALMFRMEFNQDLERWEADRLYLVFKAYAVAVDVLESQEGACEWLRSNIPALKGETPLSYLDTVSGYELIEQTLNQIRHGVYG
jgi:putative toxin-antitoxin system antitoxin component (TIGR02293 family)